MSAATEMVSDHGSTAQKSLRVRALFIILMGRVGRAIEPVEPAALMGLVDPPLAVALATEIPRATEVIRAG